MCIIRERRVRKRRKALIEAEQEARMEKADRDINTLRARANIALDTINSRDRRNHWQDSVNAMIRGVL